MDEKRAYALANKSLMLKAITPEYVATMPGNKFAKSPKTGYRMGRTLQVHFNLGYDWSRVFVDLPSKFAVLAWTTIKFDYISPTERLNLVRLCPGSVFIKRGTKLYMADIVQDVVRIHQARLATLSEMQEFAALNEALKEFQAREYERIKREQLEQKAAGMRTILRDLLCRAHRRNVGRIIDPVVYSISVKEKPE